MTLQNKNTRKIILLSLSLILGLGVIFGAAKMSGIIGANSSGTNTDEWKDGLSVVPEKTILFNAKKGTAQTVDTVPIATSTTDIIARRLLVEEFVASKKATDGDTISDDEAQKIASTLAGEVSLSPIKKYFLGDLRVSKDKSADYEVAYRKKINTLIQAHSATEEKESDLSIVVTAMDTSNGAVLKKLDTKVAIHQKIINDLLALEVPVRLISIHLHLVQGYEMLRSATLGAQNILSDPAKGIAALALYRSGIDALHTTVDEYNASRFTN